MIRSNNRKKGNGYYSYHHEPPPEPEPETKHNDPNDQDEESENEKPQIIEVKINNDPLIKKIKNRLIMGNGILEL